MLARSKLNSIENKISKALIDNGISHEDFETIINEEKKYHELKESIKMMNSNRSDAEKVTLIKEGKKIGINEVVKYNEVINNSLKSEIRISIKMKSYCLKCRQNTENINPKFQKQIMVEQCYYQNVQYVEIKNQDLLKTKKQKDH